MRRTILILSMLAISACGTTRGPQPVGSEAEVIGFAEIGQSQWNKPEYGLWHQEDAYPASFDLHDSYIRLGVESGYFRAFYFNLGSYQIEALATYDSDYATGKCPKKCRDPREFRTSGSLDGVGLSGNYRLGFVRLEAGVTYNRQTFSLERETSEVQGAGSYREERLGLGYMYGISFESGRWSLSGLVYDSRKASVFDGGEKQTNSGPVRAVAIGYKF